MTTQLPGQLPDDAMDAFVEEPMAMEPPQPDIDPAVLGPEPNDPEAGHVEPRSDDDADADDPA